MAKTVVALVGERIKAIRKDREMTQEDLAGVCKIDRNVICRYERGEREMKITTFVDFAKALNISVVDLLFDPDCPEDDQLGELMDLFRYLNDSDKTLILEMARRLI